MKKIIIVTLLAIIPFALFAQDNLDKWDMEKRWAIGVQLGTDIGGATPYPAKYIPSVFNPYPQLGVSIGARGSWSYDRRWSIHFEAIYKQVNMNAEAKVENQRSSLDGVSQYFTGTADMSMGFTMMEFPVYAKMALSDKYKDFLIFGGYYALNLDQKFITTATSGYVGSKPNMVEGVITPSDPLIMDFSDYLGNYDAGIIVGYERRIWDRVNLGLRVTIGLKDAFKSGHQVLDYKMLQMRGAVVLEYDLFLVK